MKQCNTEAHVNLKEKYADTILWFLVGEVYQAYEEDAIITAKALGIYLHNATDQNGNMVQLIVFPQHALDLYLQKMVQAGCKVGVCQQLEAPANHGIQPTLF